jgi:hypothetical protein
MCVYLCVCVRVCNCESVSHPVYVRARVCVCLVYAPRKPGCALDVYPTVLRIGERQSSGSGRE